MHRVLLAAALVTTVGCQTQNPFAAIGPATVPAPTTGQQLPYYPASAVPGLSSTQATAAPTPPPSNRISVSAESAPRPSSPATSFAPSAIVAEPADREPIRIVENSSPAIHTATAPNRGTPLTNPTPGTVAPPPNRVPAGQPSSYAPPSTSPATNRMRGFASTPTVAVPASPRSVAPAAYQQAVPTFSEIPAANGQWRAR